MVEAAPFGDNIVWITGLLGSPSVAGMAFLFSHTLFVLCLSSGIRYRIPHPRFLSVFVVG